MGRCYNSNHDHFAVGGVPQKSGNCESWLGESWGGSLRGVLPMVVVALGRGRGRGGGGVPEGCAHVDMLGVYGFWVPNFEGNH